MITNPLMTMPVRTDLYAQLGQQAAAQRAAALQQAAQSMAGAGNMLAEGGYRQAQLAIEAALKRQEMQQRQNAAFMDGLRDMMQQAVGIKLRQREAEDQRAFQREMAGTQAGQAAQEAGNERQWREEQARTQREWQAEQNRLERESEEKRGRGGEAQSYERAFSAETAKYLATGEAGPLVAGARTDYLRQHPEAQEAEFMTELRAGRWPGKEEDTVAELDKAYVARAEDAKDEVKRLAADPRAQVSAANDYLAEVPLMLAQMQDPLGKRKILAAAQVVALTVPPASRGKLRNLPQIGPGGTVVIPSSAALLGAAAPAPPMSNLEQLIRSNPRGLLWSPDRFDAESPYELERFGYQR